MTIDWSLYHIVRPNSLLRPTDATFIQQTHTHTHTHARTHTLATWHKENTTPRVSVFQLQSCVRTQKWKLRTRLRAYLTSCSPIAHPFNHFLFLSLEAFLLSSLILHASPSSKCSIQNTKKGSAGSAQRGKAHASEFFLEMTNALRLLCLYIILFPLHTYSPPSER